jgi:2-polyprenyl-3-methyl-5-hydroxy-6-metoxy-1,4-benzoquinol methylase
MSYTDRLFKEGSTLTRFSHHARAEKTLALIRASGKTTFNQVLDYGCADGWLLKALYERGMATQGLGVDINDDDLAKSRALFTEVPSFQFIKTNDLSPDLYGKFDLAVCLETLEHVADANIVLANIH